MVVDGVEFWNLFSHGAGQAIELWNCSVVMMVDKPYKCGPFSVVMAVDRL
jgi:hypothetical protein